MNKTKTVIVINGKGGCGKDTLVKFVESQYDRFAVWNVSSIDPVKEIAKTYGYDENNKSDEWRKFLSLLKEAFVGIDYKDVTYHLFKKFESFMQVDNKNGELMFVHIREPHEIDRFLNGIKDVETKEYPCNVYTLLIKREDTDSKTYGNKSDDEVENFNYDFTFVNKDGEDVDKYKFMIYLKEEILAAKKEA